MRVRRTPQLQDRSADRREESTAIARKPPVLKRATLQLSCAAALGLIVYGTLGPLGEGNGPWLRLPAAWSWLPVASASDLSDFITNFLVYIPVGIALRLLIRRRGCAGIVEIIPAFVAAMLLGYCTELLQQFMPARSASMIDVATNSIGAVVGCLLAPFVQEHLRRKHQELFNRQNGRPWSVVLWFVTLLVVVLMTSPFIPGRPTFEVDLNRPLDLVDLQRCGAFMLLGFTALLAGRERLGEIGAASNFCLRRVCFFAVVLELAQIGIAAHTTGLLDAIIAALGGLAGCCVARWLVLSGALSSAAERASAEHANHALARRTPVAAPRVFAFVALLAIMLYVVVVGFDRAGMPATAEQDSRVLWLPFQQHFMASFDVALADIVQQLLLYALLTAICMFLTSGGRRGLALALVLSLSAGVEFMQSLAPGGVADITPVVLAAAGWTIALRLWDAFVPEPVIPRDLPPPDTVASGAQCAIVNQPAP